MAGEESKPQGDGASRRTLLKVGVGVLGGGAALIAVAPAIGFVAYPLDHKVMSSGGDFLPCGKRKGFGAAPVKVDLYADQIDAWSRTRNVKIGSAWVIEVEGKLSAYTTVCPHLGCAIDFDAAASKFICPCHKSSFDLGGAVEEGPSPRPLDTLEVKEEGDLVAIRYVRFRQGTADKEEV